MAKLEIKDQSNAVLGEVELNNSIFLSNPNPSLVHEVVVMQLASRRAGTHSTKVRSEVRGGGRKPWKQKGTGQARSGSTRSPLWRGGGVTFGPKPRDYSYSMPKKKVKLALRTIISLKYAANRMFVLNKLDISEGKTKEAIAILKNLSLDRGVLFLVDNLDDKVYRSFRNIPYVDFLHVNGLNVYDLVNAHSIIILESTLPALEQRLLNSLSAEV